MVAEVLVADGETETSVVEVTDTVVLPAHGGAEEVQVEQQHIVDLTEEEVIGDLRTTETDLHVQEAGVKLGTYLTKFRTPSEQ